MSAGEVRPKLILASGSPRRRELLQKFGADFEVCPSGAPEDVRDGESPADMAWRLARDKARWVADSLQGGLTAAARDSAVREDAGLKSALQERAAANCAGQETALQEKPAPRQADSAAVADGHDSGAAVSPFESDAASLATRIGSGRILVLGADTTIDLEGEVLGKPADPEDAARMLDRLRGRAHLVITGVALVALPEGGEQSSVVATRVRMRDFSAAERDAYVATGEPMGKAGSYAIQGKGGELVQSWQGCWNNVMGLPLCEVGFLAQKLTGLSLNHGPRCVPPTCFY